MMRALILVTAAGLVLALGPAAAQEKPAAAEQKAAEGKKPAAAREKALENYRNACLACHGEEGKSQLPNMSFPDREWKMGSSIEDIAKTIREGIPGTAMLPNKDKFTEAEILELAKLVRSYDPSLKPEKGK